jgi:hypothetical protein
VNRVARGIPGRGFSPLQSTHDWLTKFRDRLRARYLQAGSDNALR